MNLSLPLLLLACLALAVWTLRDSAVHLWLKLPAIAGLLLFSTVFWYASSTMFGWASRGELPDRVGIHWVVIKEPMGESVGGIYILTDYASNRYDSTILALFAYRPDISEVRLYRLPYSRRLHQAMEAIVIPRLKDGQQVYGRFVRPRGQHDKDGKGRDGAKGGGSESLEGGWEFYELPPPYIRSKPLQDVPPGKKRPFAMLT